MTISVRTAANNDIPAIYKVAMASFMAEVAPLLSEQGQQEFAAYALPETMLERLVGGTSMFAIAEANGDCVGMVELRGGNHIAMAFVAPDRRCQGIGTALFEFVDSSAEHVEPMTVSASPNAVAFYQHLGFVATSAEQTVNGIRFVPMQRGQPARHAPAE